MSSETGAAALAALSQISEGFLSASENASVFDVLLADMQRGQLHSVFAIGSSGAVAHETPQGQAKIVSRMSTLQGGLSSRSITCMIVVSKELLRFSSIASLVEGEARKAIRRSTDAAIIPTLLESAVQVTALGLTAAEIRLDVRQALDALSVGADSRLHLIAPSSTVKRLAVLGDTAGSRAFPNVDVSGGDISGITVTPSDSLEASGSAILLDANSWVGDADPIAVDASENAAIEMAGDTATNATFDGSPPLAVEATLVSMFQANATALRLERRIGIARLRPSVVEIEGAGGLWGLIDGSPPV